MRLARWVAQRIFFWARARGARGSTGVYSLHQAFQGISGLGCCYHPSPVEVSCFYCDGAPEQMIFSGSHFPEVPKPELSKTVATDCVRLLNPQYMSRRTEEWNFQYLEKFQLV